MPRIYTAGMPPAIIAGGGITLPPEIPSLGYVFARQPNGTIIRQPDGKLVQIPI